MRQDNSLGLLVLLSAAIIMIIMLSSCAGRPVVMAGIPCNELIPDSYRTPVPSAAIPWTPSAKEVTKGQLAEFGDAQTGQLDQANHREGATIEIADKCAAWNAKAQAQARGSPWWQFWHW